MKYLQTYKKHNEGIKNTIAGLGLASALLTSPDIKASKIDTIEMNQSNDQSKVYKIANNLSELRSKNCKDQELNKILDEIKFNINDSTKVNEMFNKLSSHISSEYDYKIENKDINDLNIEEVKSNKPSESSFYLIMGWLGSLCLGICGVPQAIKSYKDKNSDGVSWGMLLLWSFGELFALAYVLNNLDMPLLMNYSVNILVVGMMLYYKLYPTRK